MVRLKTRYILVRLDFVDTIDGATESSSSSQGKTKEFPTRKDVARATQDSVKACFGTCSSDASMEIQVRLCDAVSGLVLMRVSRDNYSLIRASLTMMTSIPVTNAHSDPTSSLEGLRQLQQQLPVVASVVSAHGSIRTAKKATMEQIRRHYRCHLGSLKRRNPTIRGKDMDRECRAMEDLLLKVQSLD